MMSIDSRHSSAVSPLFGRCNVRRTVALLFVLSAFLSFIASPSYGQASGLSVSNLTFGSSQNTIIDLGGTTPAPLGQTVGVGYHDWIKVGSNWTWSGSPRFSVSTFGGFGPQLGDYFDIVTWGGNRSTTTSALIFDLPALSSPKLSWNVDFGTVSNSRLRLSVVPEPASLACIGAAAASALARRRRTV
jgi:hypothetical protein